jgi:hypothetical protein
MRSVGGGSSPPATSRSVRCGRGTREYLPMRSMLMVRRPVLQTGSRGSIPLERAHRELVW